MKGRVLIIAGSDSGGGAGIQADIKTVTMLGGYAMTAVTALTAQNTEGVFGVFSVSPDFVAKQMILCLEDIGADAMKTGMLASAPIIAAIAEVIEGLDRPIPLVVDPVMVAKGGAALLEKDAVAALKERLVRRATVLTPNLPEAEALLGRKIPGLQGMVQAATDLLRLGPKAVYLKGGHLQGENLVDVLVTADGVECFEGKRIETANTHGTGCTLASALATGIAQGMTVKEASARARDYVVRAVATAPGYGKGHGPLNHGHPLEG